MLEVRNASVSFGSRLVFSGLSFTVADGETLCITGRSGSGKSTLLRALLGFVPLSEGHISVDGELLTPSSAEEFRKSISYMPQELLLPTEWVADMVRLPFGLKANRARAFSRGLLMEQWRMLGLDEALYDKKVAELSGGQRQRVALSVSGLLGKPIMVVDEPTSALSTRDSILVLEYFKQLAAAGSTIIAASHDETVAAGCDRRIDLDLASAAETDQTV